MDAASRARRLLDLAARADELSPALRDAMRSALEAGAGPDQVLEALGVGAGGDRVEVARAGELVPGKVRTAHAFGMRLAIGNVDGRLFAVDATCPHARGPLDHGSLSGPTLTCPIHGWEFDVFSGACHTDPKDAVRTLAVEVEDGRVFVHRPASARP